jgi:hypothetical protein
MNEAATADVVSNQEQTTSVVVLLTFRLEDDSVGSFFV